MHLVPVLPKFGYWVGVNCRVLRCINIWEHSYDWLCFGVRSELYGPALMELASVANARTGCIGSKDRTRGCHDHSLASIGQMYTFCILPVPCWTSLGHLV